MHRMLAEARDRGTTIRLTPFDEPGSETTSWQLNVGSWVLGTGIAESDADALLQAGRALTRAMLSAKLSRADEDRRIEFAAHVPSPDAGPLDQMLANPAVRELVDNAVETSRLKLQLLRRDAARYDRLLKRGGSKIRRRRLARQDRPRVAKKASK